MKATITKTNNGYILRLGDELFSFEDGIKWQDESLLKLLQEINNYFGESSRYSEHRIYIVDLPGDKYEGELTEEQKATKRWLGV